MDSIFQKTADRLYPDSPETNQLKKTFFNMLVYIQENDWQGACHAATAILFVLLREQRIEAVPCVGEVSKAQNLHRGKETELHYGSDIGRGLYPQALKIAQMPMNNGVMC